MELGSSILSIYGFPASKEVRQHQDCWEDEVYGPVSLLLHVDGLLLPNNNNTNQLSPSPQHGPLPRSPTTTCLPAWLSLHHIPTTRPHFNHPVNLFIKIHFFLDLTPSQHESRVPTAPSSSPTLITTTSTPNNFITSPRHLLTERNIHDRDAARSRQ